MTDQITQAIYGIVALLGIIVYGYMGWKAKAKTTGEPFDAGKFLESVLSSGSLSTIIAVVGFSTMGLTFVGLFAAFMTGAGIDTGLHKAVKMTARTEPAPVTSP